ncbi:hypothetical protein Ddc_07733 [Ditylenchus destructor]|nr:hypothetical protein Ddc_07733 [Ditylenchus destructor]
MQASRLLQATHKFFKRRDFMFPNNKEFRKGYAKVVFRCACFFYGYAVYMYFFLYPNPAVLFDLARIKRPDFREWLDSNGYREYNPSVDREIKEYKYSLKHLKESEARRHSEAPYFRD